MKKLCMILPLVFLLCFTFSCQKAEEVAAEKETEPTIIVDNVISTDGVSIAYEVRGKGEPALLFVHGWSRNRTDWNVQMDYFAKNYKAISIDLAGYGESGNNRNNWTMEAFGEDIVSVVTHLDIKKAILIGHSMGAPVVLKSAKLIPERVVGIVPVDMLHDVGQKNSIETIDTWVNGLMSQVNNPTEEIIRSWFVNEVEEDLVSDFIQNYNSESKIGWEDSLRNTFIWTSEGQENDLISIKKPICCINTDLRVPNVDLVRKYAPTFRVKIIKGSGHFLPQEAPAEFNRVLEETIQEFVQIAEQKKKPFN
jgi:pimeloyl-ACP methyl ester carboxylesterase